MASCTQCREELAELRRMEKALGEVPPEAFLDGPPEGGDLLLQRTLRQARAERSGENRRRWAVAGAVAAAVADAVFYGGMLAGGGPGGTDVALSPAPTAPTTAPTGPGTPPAPPVGTRVASFTDPVTKARMTVRLTPAADWVRINAAVSGVPAGERCRLVVVARDGSEEAAGSWVVGRAVTGGMGKGSTGGTGKGADLDGSAAVAADHVQAVRVENEAGKVFVTVPL
jgi:hypothetical protein